VREEHTAELLAPREHVVEIGMDDVDAEIVFGKRGSTIDQQQPPLILDDQAVHADFPEPAEGNQSHRGL
jgi:hypothetical protein